LVIHLGFLITSFQFSQQYVKAGVYYINVNRIIYNQHEACRNIIIINLLKLHNLIDKICIHFHHYDINNFQ
jgi:hypothetical protein